MAPSANVRAPFADHAQRLTCILFEDDASAWPQYTSRYYLGMLPPIPGTSDLSVSDTRLLAQSTSAWHVASIRLAARIWSSYRRALYLPAKLRHSLPVLLPPDLPVSNLTTILYCLLLPLLPPFPRFVIVFQRAGEVAYVGYLSYY